MVKVSTRLDVPVRNGRWKTIWKVGKRGSSSVQFRYARIIVVLRDVENKQVCVECLQGVWVSY